MELSDVMVVIAASVLVASRGWFFFAPRQVAAAPEVSTKSAYTWRRAWAAGGEEALAFEGPSGPDRVLSEAQVVKLIAKLREGPAAAGWVGDQRWTLSRVRTLIGRRFHKTVALATVWYVLRRAGFTGNNPPAAPPNATNRPSRTGAAISGPR